MEDIFITTLIIAAESDMPPTETGVTLMVGGFLVSGYVISYDKYCASVPEASQINKIISEVKSSISSDKNEENDTTRHFIHLRDAKYFHPGNHPIPNNMPVFCRISLSSIQGFHFGNLTAETT